MATLKLTAPVVAPVTLTSPTGWYKTREGLKKQMIETWAKYGKWFKYYAETSRVPAEVLFAFTMVESNGNPLAGGSSSPTQGLMQWNRNYASGTGDPTFTLTKEFKQGRLTQAEKDKLASFGIKFDAQGNSRKLTQADLQNPELNILIGSITLGQYIDKEWGKDAEGNIRMDRVISLYNWGPVGFKNNAIATKTLPQILVSIPSTTKAYIEKMLGKNGALDIAINDKIIS
jgi:soluble lytic murein transglycosylase-like protein